MVVDVLNILTSTVLPAVHTTASIRGSAVHSVLPPEYVFPFTLISILVPQPDAIPEPLMGLNFKLLAEGATKEHWHLLSEVVSKVEKSIKYLLLPKTVAGLHISRTENISGI